MSASFKGFYKAAKFYSQKPQVCSLIAEADKNVAFPLLLSIFTGSRGSPACTDPSCSMVIKGKQTGDLQYHLGNLFLFKAISIIPRFDFPLTLQERKYIIYNIIYNGNK